MQCERVGAMFRQNVEVVRTLYDHWARGDLAFSDSDAAVAALEG
jgi:hypothetical protein